MILVGANIEKKEVSFNQLSSYDWFSDKNLTSIVKLLEVFYNYISNAASKSQIHQMNIDEKGKIIIPKHATNHRCTKDIENLRAISEYGVLASEWFGQIESEREGCFCTFLSKMKGESYNYIGSLAEDDHSRLTIGDNVLLFFDDENEIMKYLLHLDYFEFEKNKSENPNYKDLYSENELKILEELIEPVSPAGKNMRNDYDFKTNYWSAIPGGIPSYLINGVCIKNNNYPDEELDEINSFFPNAYIFNSKKEIIRCPIDIVDKKIENDNSSTTLR